MQRARSAPLSITAFSNLLYAYDNSPQQEATLSSVTDRGPGGRTLTVNGTASAQPRAFPRNWEQNGQGVLSFNGGANCYAQDQAADKLTYATPLHQAGIAFVVRCEIGGLTSASPIFSNWGGATSNQNALTLEYDDTDSSQKIRVYVTSKTNNGTIHILATSVAGEIQKGDVVTITFKHKTDKTWSLKYVREGRFPGDPRVTRTVTNSYSSTIHTGAPDYGLTIGAYGGLGTFHSTRIHSLAIMQIGATTDAEITAWEDALAARCNFGWLSWDYDQALALANMTDGKHWNASGDEIVGSHLIVLEQAAVTALGATGTVKVGVVGDSRLTNTGASGARGQAQTYASFTRSAVGPVDDGTGRAERYHFARSAYVTRTNTANSGHSQRSTHANSIDNFIGASKSYNDTQIFDWVCGINEIAGAGLARPLEWDYCDEECRIFEYLRETCIAQSGVTPGFVILSEPITGTTTIGIEQRRIRTRNRARHAMIAALRARGFVVKYGNLNDQTYYP